MNDEWRLQIDFRDDGVVDALQDRLDAHDVDRFHPLASGSLEWEPGDRQLPENDLPKPFAFLGGPAG